MDKIYVVVASYFEGEDTITNQLSAWSSRELAEEEIQKYLRFYPKYWIHKFSGNNYYGCYGPSTKEEMILHRACKYELYKMGLMCNWEDNWNDIPALYVVEINFIK